MKQHGCSKLSNYKLVQWNTLPGSSPRKPRVLKFAFLDGNTHIRTAYQSCHGAVRRFL
ncbi:hypothetical protein PISMIDRAFT_679254 [Pisolithus microcarpus 441]|uniref:Uncharacterized protein n=1 Tax=Pisolithus microcarpus 441 TaxID=765257 RepID=A0A0C9ZV64_9AGAM|nr:hypothetical protein PISMIDRAFT_679254 [Pisolithus microcarpus 441]